jgi:hypothetical protein
MSYVLITDWLPGVACPLRCCCRSFPFKSFSLIARSGDGRMVASGELLFLQSSLGSGLGVRSIPNTGELSRASRSGVARAEPGMGSRGNSSSGDMLCRAFRSGELLRPAAARSEGESRYASASSSARGHVVLRLMSRGVVPSSPPPPCSANDGGGVGRCILLVVCLDGVLFVLAEVCMVVVDEELLRDRMVRRELAS